MKVGDRVMIRDGAYTDGRTDTIETDQSAFGFFVRLDAPIQGMDFVERLEDELVLIGDIDTDEVV